MARDEVSVRLHLKRIEVTGVVATPTALRALLFRRRLRLRRVESQAFCSYGDIF